MPTSSQATVIIHNGGLAGLPSRLAFSAPVQVVTARTLPEVLDALREVEAAVARGYYAAGFITYEAAPAFDPALAAHPSGALPLLWFGIYSRWSEASSPMPGAFTVSPWTPDISKDDYLAAIARIKAYIARGDTYQVNYTQRLSAEFTGDPQVFFASRCQSSCAPYGAYLDIGDHVLCSVSPELFFLRNGQQLTCRPMKGTAARGLTTSQDNAQAAWLQASAKNRAENVMIVDMVRNDLGRIAGTGSVKVPRLFDVEQYDTLWQMTSTVTARSSASFSEILTALFPCASITGAPKVRTSQIIAELEPSPRGVYTGAIGVLTPDGDAQFNVAIRTAHLDRRSGRMEYGTGGGITWSSSADDEYEECRVKTLALTSTRPTFQLLETLLWKPESGYALLDRHLRRLADSARYFGYAIDINAIEAALIDQALSFTERRRVRLLVGEEGKAVIESTPLTASPHRRWRVTYAAEPIATDDHFLYHKTTHRACYNAARTSAPGYDDVLLWNARGEVTESTIANLVIRYQQRLLTPPVHCGLLAGTCRDHLLECGRIEEAVLTRAMIREAEAAYLINSVRGWIPIMVDDAGCGIVERI